MSTSKNKVQIIKFNSEYIVMQLVVSAPELTVLKCALKQYANGYGLSLLKRIEKTENETL